MFVQNPIQDELEVDLDIQQAPELNAKSCPVAGSMPGNFFGHIGALDSFGADSIKPLDRHHI